MKLSADVIIRRCATGLAYTGAFCLLGDMLLGAAGVIGDLIKIPVPGMMAYSSVLLTGAVFFPLMLAQYHKRHIVSGVVGSRLGPRARYIIFDWIGTIMTFLFFVILLWKAPEVAWKSTSILEFTAEGATVYLYPGKIAIAIGLVGITVMAFIQIINLSIDLLKGKGP